MRVKLVLAQLAAEDQIGLQCGDRLEVEVVGRADVGDTDQLVRQVRRLTGGAFRAGDADRGDPERENLVEFTLSRTTTRVGLASRVVSPRAWVMVRGNSPGAASLPSFAVSVSAVLNSLPPVATSVLPFALPPASEEPQAVAAKTVARATMATRTDVRLRRVVRECIRLPYLSAIGLGQGGIRTVDAR